MDNPSHHVTVRPGTPADAGFVERTLISRWGALVAARRDELVDLTDLATLVAECDGTPAGVLTYKVDGDTWEVVTIDATRQGVGVGRALLDGVADLARSAAARRLWLVTTNDNTRALRFYQRYGFDLVALHRNAVDRTRVLKPEIPVTGQDGIPIRHELELDLML